MLPETRATSYAHDAAVGTVVLFTNALSGAGGSRPSSPPGSGGRGLHGDQPARLLLDGSGHLVGIDVAPESTDRLIVMLGPHEAVASTKDARVSVENGGQKVTLHGTAARLVAPGASPYVF